MAVPHRPRRPRRCEAFTLLELIVVITIIGIISSIVVVKYQHVPERGRAVKVKADLEAIVDAADLIYVMTGGYPDSIREMVNAMDADGRSIGGLEKLPTDPWGHEYLFAVDEGQAYATCLGSDGVEGGEGEARDVTVPSTG